MTVSTKGKRRQIRKEMHLFYGSSIWAFFLFHVFHELLFYLSNSVRPLLSESQPLS